MNAHHKDPLLNVSKLKEEAGKFKPLEDLMCLFALRGRTRARITVRAMRLTLIQEGFEYTDAQLGKAFKILSDAGYGRLEMDAKGKIIALKDIWVKLPDLGNAVVGPQKAVATFKSRNKFLKVPFTVQEPGETPLVPVPRNKTDEAGEPYSFIVQVRNNPVQVTFPKGSDAKDVVDVLVFLQKSSSI